MLILCAFDSFKGTLTALEASEIVSGVLRRHPGHTLRTLPIADGGEGTLESLIHNLEGRKERIEVKGPGDQRVMAEYGRLADGTAVIEMAEAAGLTLLETHERNPLYTSSEGVGMLIRDALEKGARHFIIGIGGSATNDMGMGILHALGYRFKDQGGNTLMPNGASLIHVKTVDEGKVHPALKHSTFTIACDVMNPLYGKNGAAYVYAPQKGADERTVRILDEGLRHLSRVAADHTGKKENLQRDGAAGGIGAGLRMFLGAELRNGFDVVYETAGIEALLRTSDLLITGEGTIDHQTLEGKAPLALASKAKAFNLKTIALSGRLDIPEDRRDDYPFDAMFGSFNGPMEEKSPPDNKTARKHLEFLAGEVARLIFMK
ncbi:MAG: glycerate kinase [Candidatus Izemoplasmataceae bacterium]